MVLRFSFGFPVAPTIIPDTHAIHLAKKKREQMRLRNDREEEEFVSLIGGDDDTVSPRQWLHWLVSNGSYYLMNIYHHYTPL